MIVTIHLQVLLATFAGWIDLSGHRPFPLWYIEIDINADSTRRTEFSEGTGGIRETYENDSNNSPGDALDVGAHRPTGWGD